MSTNNNDNKNNNHYRRSTVHDLTSLRLHPDGTRITLNKNKGKEKARAVAYTVKDRHGNWIAGDAGGVAGVPVFRKKKKRRIAVGDADTDEEVFDLDVVDERQDAEDDGMDVPKGAETKNKRALFIDPRALKRKKFYDDLVNLPTDIASSSVAPHKIQFADNEFMLPLPSSVRPSLQKSMYPSD